MGFLNKNLFRHSFFGIILKGGNALAMFVLSLFVVKVYSTELFGKLTFLLGVSSLLPSISSLGLNVHCFKFIPQQRDHDSISFYITTSTLITLSISFLLITVILFLGLDIIECFVLLILTLIRFKVRLLRALEMNTRSLVHDQLFWIILLVLISSIATNLEFFEILAVAVTLNLSIMIVYLKEYYSFKYLKLYRIGYQLRESLYLSVSSLVQLSFNKMDIIAIKIFFDDYILGIYGICTKIAQAVQLPILGINNIGLSKLSNLVKTSRERFITEFNKYIKLIWVTTLPLFIIIIVFGDLFIGIYDPSIANYHNLLIILVCGYAINVVFGPIENNLVIYSYEREMLYISIITLIVYVVILYFAKYIQSIYYLSYTFLVAYLINNIMIYYLNKKKSIL